MRWSEVQYSYTFKIADYVSQVIGIKFAAEEGEDTGPQQALELAQDFVHALHARPIPGQPKANAATVTVKAPGASKTPVSRPVTRPPVTSKAGGAPRQSSGGGNKPKWLTDLLAMPYSIELPFPDKANWDVTGAKQHLKDIGYSFASVKSGGDNLWHGETEPDFTAFPDLENCIKSSVAPNPSSGGDGEDIPGWMNP